MCLLYWLFLLMRQYALDGQTKRPQRQSVHTPSARQAPANRITHTRRRLLVVDGCLPERPVSVAAPSSIETLGRMHSLPRSLPRTSSSSVPHPLLIGFLIGVFGTLFVQGFMFILYRVCRRHRMGKRARPFGSSEARHIEQFTMSASTTSLNGTASLLRVAHRNPDGSWSFTNSNDQSTSQTASTPALSPSQSSASPPWSPDASTSTTTASPSYSRPLPTPPWSPDTLALSSSSNSNSRAPPSAFPPELAQSSSQMDVVDCGSSARTGPPPYNTMPLPVPSIPREYRTAKEHHRR